MEHDMMAMTEEEFERQYAKAVERGRTEAEIEPRAAAARYDERSHRIEVELTNGCLFAFPSGLVEELEGAASAQLAAVEVDPGGEGLRWEALDVDIAVPGLIADLLNVRSWAAKYLGQRTSPAKAAAARINGRRGGRPRKGE